MISISRLESIETAFRDLFNHNTSLAKIRDAALADRLFKAPEDVLAVPGRSIAWKLFLLPSEPLKTPMEADHLFLLETLKAKRSTYTEFLLDMMRAPDGGYEEGFTVPGPSASAKRISRLDVNLERNNPLSLHTENPWTEWFASVELRKTILQDVERTFPEVDFFRLSEVQAQLTHILFIYATMNPSIGYRQGMHELLAPLYYAVYVDSIAESDVQYLQDAKVQDICAKHWVAADSWSLFDAVMKSASRWYEWHEPTSTAQHQSSLQTTHINLNVSQPRGTTEMKPYVAPIVQTCNTIQASLLRTTDPLLWQRLQTTGIEPQIYGIRWLRLLFTREFSLPDSMKLWDALFACDTSFELAPWICVAMLIRIRNELLPADYTGQLTSLLRYSNPQRTHEYSARVNDTSLLVRQALALQMSPTPATCVALVSENWSLLNIPIDVPEPPPVPRARSTPSSSRGRPASMAASGSSTQAHTRQQSSQQLGFPEMLARGILERGESFGINKSLMSAVSELKKNIPDIASSLIRSPTTSAPSFPLRDDSEVQAEKPPWEHRSRINMEREITDLREVNRKFGDSLTWIVDVLLQDEGAFNPELLKKKRREAVESLAYVRDMMISNSTNIDEDRLFGEEERKKQKLKAKMRESRQPKVPAPSLPIPEPVADSLSSKQIRNSGSFVDGTIGNLSSRTSPIQAVSPPIKPATEPAMRAPWHYTRTNFGSPSSAVEATLPRPPPPSSAAIRPLLPSKSNSESRHKTKESNSVLQDPLGALH